MSVKATGPPRRGKRSPTAVWILSRRGKNGTTYRIRWVDLASGKTLSEACGRDLALARLARDRKKAELREGLSGRLPDRTISDLMAELPGFMVGKSSDTIRITLRALSDLVRLCGDRRLEHVDRNTIMGFRSKRIAEGVSPATMNIALRSVKSALSYAVDCGWLRTNPLWRWKGMQLREPEKAVRVLESDEFHKLLESCPNPLFRVLLVVAYYQGLRRTELVNLRWTAINLDTGILRVVNRPEADELTKSRKNRTLPLRQMVREQLKLLYADVPKIVVDGRVQPKHPHVFTWDDGRPFTKFWASHEFARIAKRAGISHCSLHDLRKSFSTLAQRAGIDKAVVKDLGGWSTIGVVEKHYTGEVAEASQRAMAQLDAVQGVA